MSAIFDYSDQEADEGMEMGPTEGQDIPIQQGRRFRLELPGHKPLSKMKWKKLIILSVSFHVYLLLGAGIFYYLERSHEDDIRQKVRQFKAEILQNYTCIDSELLEEIIDVVVDAAENGINPARNVSSPSNWDFGSAFFFSGITVTTIGYGHIAPTTTEGRTFCIIFALIGIPACGIMLTAIGEKLSNLTELAEKPFRSKLKRKWQRVLFHLCIIGGSMFVFFITIPAIIFTYIEDWTLHEAWYYCFITVTTIGFGDYVVEQNGEKDYPDVYVVMVYFWIIFGLSYLALIIQQIGKILASTGKVVQERVSSTVTTVATAMDATGKVVHDRVSKQFSHIKDSIGDPHIRYSSSDEEGVNEEKRKRKPSKRLHYRPSKKGPSSYISEAPEIQISPSHDAVTPTKRNGTNNGNLTVVDPERDPNPDPNPDPEDRVDTESVVTAVSDVGHDNEVELKDETKT